MNQTQKGSILVMSSHVVRGAVGNRAAVFALETLGHPVWAMPTVILPWHPGHGRSTRIALPDDSFAAACADLSATSKRNELTAVLTGYFGSAGQVEAAGRLISALKLDNPDLVYLCDPVIGDLGGLYVPEAVAAAIRDHLLPLADIATPNRFELAWLTATNPETNLDLAAAAGRLSAPQVLVTSAFEMMDKAIGNLLVTAETLLMAEHRALDRVPNGLGDLLAALYLARTLAGESPERALQAAASSVFEIVTRTVRDGGDELAIARQAASLSTPMAMVQMRRLMRPGQKPKLQPVGI